MFSRSADYAIRAIVHLAKQPTRHRVPLQRIAQDERIPSALLSKILQKLVKGGFIRSYRGLHGGYAISGPADRMSLKAIVETIDGPMVVFECLDHPDCCDFNRRCGLQNVFLKAQMHLTRLMADATVADCLPQDSREPTHAPSS